jgi:hypothetical protein
MADTVGYVERDDANVRAGGSLLSDGDLYVAIADGRLGVHPSDPELVQPASGRPPLMVGCRTWPTQTRRRPR